MWDNGEKVDPASELSINIGLETLSFDLKC
jgi:hypothetical protein